MKETYRLVSQSFLYTHRAPASLQIKGPKGGWGNFPKEYIRNHQIFKLAYFIPKNYLDEVLVGTHKKNIQNLQ